MRVERLIARHRPRPKSTWVSWNRADIWFLVLKASRDIAVNPGMHFAWMPRGFALRHHHATWFQCASYGAIKVTREQSFTRSNRIGRIDDRDVDRALQIAHISNAIADLDFDPRVV